MSVKDQLEQVLAKAAEVLTGFPPDSKQEYQLRTRITNSAADPVKVDIQDASLVVEPGDATSEDPTTGTTSIETGTVGTVNTSIPAVAGGIITSCLIEVPQTNTSTTILFVSFDGGSTYKTMGRGSSFAWSPRGGITQLTIKANEAGVSYEIVINRNDP